MSQLFWNCGCRHELTIKAMKCEDNTDGLIPTIFPYLVAGNFFAVLWGLWAIIFSFFNMKVTQYYRKINYSNVIFRSHHTSILNKKQQQHNNSYISKALKHIPLIFFFIFTQPKSKLNNLDTKNEYKWNTILTQVWLHGGCRYDIRNASVHLFQTKQELSI